MPERITEQKHNDIRDAINAGMHGTDIRKMLNTSTATITATKREMGIAIRPMKTRTREPVQPVAQVAAPAQAYTPQEYFEAIADGLRQRSADNSTLLQENNSLRAQTQQIEAENRKLIADLNQCKHQMANWSGPMALPNRSLGNGG